MAIKHASCIAEPLLASMLRSLVVECLDSAVLQNVRLLTFIALHLPQTLQFLLLGPLKWLASNLSGHSTLYRLCALKRFRQPGLCGQFTRLVALHLRLSRSLQAESRLLFDAPKARAVEIDRLRTAKIIALRKGIPLESRAFEQLQLVLERIWRLERLIAQVTDRAHTVFDPKGDLPKLKQLWNNLMGTDAQAPPLPSDRWTEIGFQGSDPGTDFRGMGVWGLEQLVAFTSDQRSHPVWQQSRLGTAPYSFAIVGINLTALVHDLLTRRLADAYFYQTGQDVRNVHSVYGDVFAAFAEAWVEEKAKDAMDFGRVHSNLRQRILATLAVHSVFFQ